MQSASPMKGGRIGEWRKSGAGFRILYRNGGKEDTIVAARQACAAQR